MPSLNVRMIVLISHPSLLSVFSVSLEQLEQFRALKDDNGEPLRLTNRPVQPVNDRGVLTQLIWSRQLTNSLIFGQPKALSIKKVNKRRALADSWTVDHCVCFLSIFSKNFYWSSFSNFFKTSPKGIIYNLMTFSFEISINVLNLLLLCVCDLFFPSALMAAANWNPVGIDYLRAYLMIE